MLEKLSSLADYPAFKKLASALWQQGTSYHGAAVMLGAGFSKSAAETGDPKNNKLPLWNDFSSVLSNELGSKTLDPLRLAEEYCAYFGRQALNDLIKNEINDSIWSPGELHKRLLELPWTDVLTTNWDTLLEKASEEIHSPTYCVVNKPADLSSARSPRIVKLHGTINITEGLVFTQEDYRKYPQNYAAFVNFARQVFIENELCLLGFSGDDPNFLQWAGWVRDQLADHSRRIYLVGVLKLNSAKRKYLESINVSPIDLSSLVVRYEGSESQHYEASKIFVDGLYSLKPIPSWEWRPRKLETDNVGEGDIKQAAKELERQLVELEKDRDLYPGWLVCPTDLRRDIYDQINHPLQLEKVMAEVNPSLKGKLLYEIVWRYNISFEVPEVWLIKALMDIFSSETNSNLNKAQEFEIALFILRNSVWYDEETSMQILNTIIPLLEKEAEHNAEIQNELTYHRAQDLRSSFDYVGLTLHIKKINAISPIWGVKKASLLAEIGDFDEAKSLLVEANKELLNQHRKDRKSMPILSSLAWTEWLLRMTNDFLTTDTYSVLMKLSKQAKCSPWDYKEYLENLITAWHSKQLETKRIQPLFSPGRYKDGSRTIAFHNFIHPLFLLNGITRSGGLPLRWKSSGIISDLVNKLCEIDGLESKHRFVLAVLSATNASDDVLNKVFSRTQIACLVQSEIQFLIDNCKNAIEYWAIKIEENSG